MQYEIKLGALGSLTPRVNWTYRSTIYLYPDNNDPYSQQGSYGLGNGRFFVPAERRELERCFLRSAARIRCDGALCI